MEFSAANCERMHVQEARVSHLSVFSQPPPLCPYFFLLHAKDKRQSHTKSTLMCLCNSPLPCIHVSARHHFSFIRQYHGSYHACRVSLFSVIAFPVIGPSGSYCSVQGVARHHSERGTDQNKWARFFFSTGPSLRMPLKQMSRDYPIPVERRRLCFCLWVCFTRSKMSSIFRRGRAEMLNDWTV